MMVKKLICLAMTLVVAVSCFGVSAVAAEVTLCNCPFRSISRDSLFLVRLFLLIHAD